MRLISVTVRNYRIHQDQTVAFHRERTLIGGTNETGKSTLVEAIHRALFLRAKGNTEHHRAMRARSGGHPEVELAFELAGLTYTVRKRFGASGSVNLLRPCGEPLIGDEAEQKLAELLSVEAVPGKAVLSQWAHLWVWQGKACEDPSADASRIKADLLNRLQEIGAAAVLQSDRDTRVAAKVAAEFEEIYTSSGKTRAGSELDAAECAVTEARQRRDAAAGRLAVLESAASAFEAARIELPQIEENLRTLEKEQSGIEERSAQVTEFQRQHLGEIHQAKNAAAHHEALTTANARILKLETTIRRDEALLAPLQQELANLTASSAALRRAAGEAQRAYDAATETSRQARMQRDLAHAQHRLFTLQKEILRLEERQTRANAFRKDLGDLEQQRGKLPKLNTSKLRELQKVEMECEKAWHTVQSVATGIEFLNGDVPVLLDGRTLSPGEKCVVTEETQLSVGDRIRLRILPGGGTSLAEARNELADREKALRNALSQYAIDSVARASEFLALREQLNTQIEKTQAQMDELDGDSIREQLAFAAEALSGVTATIARMREQFTASSECSDESAARGAVSIAEVSLEQAESAESAAKAARDTGAQKGEQADAFLCETQAKFNRQNQALDEKRAEVRVLVQTHGEEKYRGDAILAAEQHLKTCQARVDAVRRSIDALQPDMLETDRKRVKRSIEQARERKTFLGNTNAAAEVTLRSDGMEDPQSALAAAELQLKSAQSRLGRAQCHAAAITLLHRCFQEEQQSLSEHFTRPLAEKISSYLQCLFGSSARATIELNEEGFSGLSIARGPNAQRFRFETLSGGTQEQTAAAVRLAMAEVLAADHDNCLPVVFDDAFVYSDPERVHRLQRMLDYAAEAGLQVILLTCKPVDYAALGAHQVTLHRPAQDRADPSGPMAKRSAGPVESDP